MEDALRVEPVFSSTGQRTVLILVLMEDALRDESIAQYRKVCLVS